MRRRKAIRLYRRVLVVEPGNADVHAKVAPLLARKGQTYDAWTSYRRAGRTFIREGLVERALANYREAARMLPRQVEPWLVTADLERKSGRERDAIRTLLEGRCRMRGRKLRPQAIYLLRRVREVDAWNLEAVLDLAALLARTDQGEEAELLLDDLASRCTGRDLRRVRGVQWRMTPTLRNTWLWLRAAFGARHSASGAPERV
jgi:tetratricopeptide (TPR) repeat protein